MRSSQESKPCREGSVLFRLSAGGGQLDLFTAEFDLKLIAGLQTQQRGVGLTHQQVAVALNRGHIAELAAALAGATAAAANAETFGLQQSLIEGSEVQTL